MSQYQDQLNALSEIRNIMVRTSKFVSLSGLSGISAGLSALCGAAVVNWYFTQKAIHFDVAVWEKLTTADLWFLAAVAMVVFAVALGLGIYFTLKNARGRSHENWNLLSQRMMWNLLIPLAAGGAFCCILIYHHLVYLIPASMLLFYGLALLNSSKYTFGEIRLLSFIEIALGLLAAIFVTYALLLWAIGFGILHLLFGIMVYYKHER